MLATIREAIAPWQESLQSHRVYGRLRTEIDLVRFMEHHVFCVWDFMSLLKALQARLAPAHTPWSPPVHRGLARLINEIVLTEESDLDHAGQPMSHFELYCHAMKEVGADGDMPMAFAKSVAQRGLATTVEDFSLNAAVATFLKQTFSYVADDRVHMAAAAFAFGREAVIPAMFRGLLKDMAIGEDQAPSFYFYLHRHIEVDENDHGPMAEQIVAFLCGDDPNKWQQAKVVAEESLKARIALWDHVSDLLASAP